MKNTEENKTQEEIMSPTDIVIVSPETTFDSSELGKTFVEKRDAALNELLSIENEKNLKQEVLKNINEAKEAILKDIQEKVKEYIEVANSSGEQIGVNKQTILSQEEQKSQNSNDISQQIQYLSALTTVVPQISEIVTKSKEMSEASQKIIQEASTDFPALLANVKDSVQSILELGELARETMHYVRNDMMAIERSQNERNEALNKREENANVRELAIEAMRVQVMEKVEEFQQKNQ